jgi:hypothetical protein
MYCYSMDTSVYQVSPESISVVIREFKDFFSVGISFVNVEAIFKDVDADIDNDDDLVLSEEDIDLDAPIDYEGATWVSSGHLHTLMIAKDLPFSMSRDEILMKLKLSFPNHEYKLVED